MKMGKKGPNLPPQIVSKRKYVGNGVFVLRKKIGKKGPKSASPIYFHTDTI